MVGLEIVAIRLFERLGRRALLHLLHYDPSGRTQSREVVSRAFLARLMARCVCRPWLEFTRLACRCCRLLMQVRSVQLVEASHVEHRVHEFLPSLTWW